MGNFGFQEILLLLIIFLPIGLIIYFGFIRKSNPIPEEEKGEDKLHIGLQILSFLIPLAGAVIYFANKDNYPNKAGTAARTAWWGFGIGILTRIIYAFL